MRTHTHGCRSVEAVEVRVPASRCSSVCVHTHAWRLSFRVWACACVCVLAIYLILQSFASSPVLAKFRRFNQTGHPPCQGGWPGGVAKSEVLGIRYRGLFGNYLIYYRVGGSGEGPLNFFAHTKPPIRKWKHVCCTTRAPACMTMAYGLSLNNAPAWCPSPLVYCFCSE